MRFKRGKEEEARLGIAPLIDIVFLLLIFFMVTSHFDVASGVRIRLPQVARKLYEPKKNRIILVIDKSGKTYLEGKGLERDVLQKTLEQLVSQKDLTHLILQADKDVRHGTVVTIMDLAKTAGVQSIIIAAQWKSGKVF
ncbi:MAG: biopolymer transporter ExbD [Pseudomonadota bacterium]